MKACFLPLLVIGVSSTFGQAAPKLNTVTPEWVQRGASVELSFKGEHLAGAPRFLTTDSNLVFTNVPPSEQDIRVESERGGISAAAPQDSKRLVVRLAVKPNASLGRKQIRVATSTGVSDPIFLNVGALPELAEKAGPHAREGAQMISLPCTISGSIGAPAETDSYKFAAKQGQHLVFEVQAARFGSSLDSSLVLLNSAGKEVARDEDSLGLDSLLDYTIPADGEYFIEVRDFRFQGGPKFTYRLSAGMFPFARSHFPIGGQRGRPVQLELAGPNLNSPEKASLQIAPDAPLGRQEIRIETSRGISNPIPFVISNLPDFLEAEPNQPTEKANAITPPVALNGRIQTEKDVDSFKFHAKKNERLVFEIMAERFGSPLDALLTLRDSKGNVLEKNDDAAEADARIDRTFAEEGDYTIGVEDLLQRGGPNFVYRLEVRRPQPDFALQFAPDNPQIHRGGHTPIRCQLTRVDGFNETVVVNLARTIPGLIAEPVVFSPNSPSVAMLILTATEDAPLGFHALELEARSGNTSTSARRAEPLSSDRPVANAFITVLERAPFQVDLLSQAAVLDQDETGVVRFLVQRQPGFMGEIQVAAEGYTSDRESISRSFDAAPLTIKANETTGELKLKAKNDAEIGTRPVWIRGETTITGEKVIEYSHAFPISVDQIPFVLSTTLRRLSVTALPSSANSAAREASFVVKAGRRAGFDGEIEITLEGVPEGITASIEKVAPGKSEAAIKLVASEKAPAGKEIQIKIGGKGFFKNRFYTHQSEPVQLTVNAPQNLPDPTLAQP